VKDHPEFNVKNPKVIQAIYDYLFENRNNIKFMEFS